MLKTVLIQLFERDLLKLKEEIHLYTREEDLWAVNGAISNSAGNLCLHLIGNLNHFVGAQAGKTGYVRERDKEFSDKHVPRVQLLAAIDDTIDVVTSTLQAMPHAALEELFPGGKRGEPVQTDYMLLHLLSHLSYHLGQINYHRRLLATSLS